ncbi:hypothetical protein Bbelb_317160 [Branchiostoma belcheri]|nr:hypothetical protein Bbelb_317160 [Branchiostoma belcheri]
MAQTPSPAMSSRFGAGPYVRRQPALPGGRRVFLAVQKPKVSSCRKRSNSLRLVTITVLHACGSLSLIGDHVRTPLQEHPTLCTPMQRAAGAAKLHGIEVTAAARSRPGIQPTVLYTVRLETSLRHAYIHSTSTILQMKGPHKYYLYGALPGTVYLVLDTR